MSDPADGAAARGNRRGTANRQNPLVEVSGLCETYASGRGTPVRARDEVGLAIEEGQTVALTGPSGSGRSTLRYLLGALEQPVSAMTMMPATHAPDVVARRDSDGRIV
ncbi:ATP-binding cassette domain-containing protein [Streptomyces albipurpureus]|uniref:ATP-binding cassette domain-containing protein n=1 Tax=Streptomyces albipurpureus TaxID=2897419 RepID=A0ABT0ULN2_9ACTN|nr:ATP-binding cassette domain-containing protein [Streptomyces sp. CWNU-1]MCM2388313.1 ATP-binding cassette domain-containing protein [Streptomyces sp. CWNU-1]